MNVLFILTDQQSWNMMGCAGNTDVHTPAMDKLAAGGVRFDRVYCTNPVCVPSRFSLFSGRMPSTIGVRNNEDGADAVIPQELLTRGLGWLLHEAGYGTFYAGKVHLPCGMSVGDIGFQHVCRDERQGLADFAASWLHDAPREPFCFVTSFINPHDICFMPIVDSQRDERECAFARREREVTSMQKALAHPEGMDDETFYAGICPGLPGNFEPQTDEPGVIQDILAGLPCRKMAREEWSIERWREYRWTYKNLTERVDAEIDRVLEALRDSGLANNTVVIFTSDHGDMGGAHRLPHKEVLYEEACRVPLIIRDPSLDRPGAVESHLVSNGLDLIPTLCAYAGIEPSANLPGRSLKPLVDGEAPREWREHVPVESDRGRAIVGERYKYVRCDRGSQAEQFYDLETNPGEMWNDAGDPACRDVLIRYRTAFEQTYRS